MEQEIEDEDCQDPNSIQEDRKSESKESERIKESGEGEENEVIIYFNEDLLCIFSLRKKWKMHKRQKKMIK